MANNARYRGRTDRRGRKRHRSRRRTGVTYKIFSLIVIAAAIIFGMTVFFKVDVIEIEGNSHYTDEQIRNASGFEYGDNLLTLTRSFDLGDMYAKLPYVREVRLLRGLPDKLIIEVKESKAVAYVTFGDEYWLVDNEGILLEKVPPTMLGGRAQITGLDILGPAPGGQIYVPQGQENRKLAAVGIIGTFGEILDRVSTIDITRDNDVRLLYENRLEIRLGVPTEIQRKWDFFSAVLKAGQIGEDEKAVVDLSDVDLVRVIPVIN